jgi:NAD(P)-dependent dehydrogenase (short-subunit alcohol dehydrogenase family)
MSDDWRGRVVVVTGASAGVGRATARELGRRGASVALLARGIDGLAATAREVEALGGRALALPTDVADPAEVDLAADAVERELGLIDVWVNNAMVSVFSPVKQMTAGDFQRVTDVTYLGVVHGTLSALKRMLRRDRGVIVQVGSALGYRSIPLQSAYCAAKHAARGFTESLRTELMHDESGVRVIEVNLPALNTPQFGWVKSRLPHRPQPIPPVYAPEVAARAIVWAAMHPQRGRLDVGMTTVKTLFGQRLIPGLLDRLLARIGYQRQQAKQLASPDRPNNLWAPVAGDHGASGTLGDRIRRRSAQLWATTHRPSVAAATLALGTMGLLGAFLITRRA